MAIIATFDCYICNKSFNMAYGGLWSNPSPNPRNCICPRCRDNHQALKEIDETSRKAFEITKNVKESCIETIRAVRAGDY